MKTQTEKSDLQGKLQANEAQIAELQKHIDEMNKNSANPNPGAPSVAELQAQLDDARKQLEGAEHEKTFIAERLGPTREQIARSGSDGPAPRAEFSSFRPRNRAGGESGLQFRRAQSRRIARD